MSERQTEEKRQTLHDSNVEQARMQQWIRQLDEAEQALQEMTNGAVDAVATPNSDTPYLLRQAQAKLQASEARYRRLVQRVPAVVCELEPDGTILFVNEAITAVAGYRPQDLLGDNWAAIFLSAISAAELGQIGDRLRAGDLQNFELEMAARDGRSLTLLWNTANEYDDDGRLQRIVGYGVDISRRKQAESRLQQSREKQQQLAHTQQRILDALPANVALLDHDGNILAVNQAWRVFGRENDGESYEQGWNYLRVCDAAAGPDAREARLVGRGLRRVLSGDQAVFTHEYPCHAPDEQRWFHVLAAPLQDESAGAVVMHIDVTARKKAQLAWQREHDMLQERVKELMLLHKAARLMQSEIAPEQLLPRLVSLLPPAWQYGEVAEARIRYGNADYRTIGFKETPWQQQVIFHTDDGTKGLLEVVYTEERPSADIGPFLREEQSLLFTLADMVSSYLDQRTARKSLVESEQQRRARERLLRQLAENIHEVFWLRDLKRGQILYVNNVYEEIFQQPVSQLYDDPESFLASVHEEDRERVKAAREGQALGRLDERYRVVRPDGTVRWVWARTFPITDERGEVYRVVGTAQDITERIQRERRLEALARVSYVLRDIEGHDGVTPAVLRQLQRIFNTDHVLLALRDQADGVTVAEQGHGAYAPFVGMRYAESETVGGHVMETGRPYRTNAYHQQPFAAAQPLPETVTAVASVPLITRDAPFGALTIGMNKEIDNSTFHLLATIGDIMASAVRRALLYRQTRAHAAQLQQILDTAPVGMLLLDEENRVLRANPAGARKIDLLAGIGIGETLERLADVPLAELLHHFQQRNTSYELKIEEPEEAFFEMAAQSMQLHDGSAGHVVLLKDVTQERHVQERISQRERLAAVGQLAAGIAHDFNNIMSVITIQAQLLARSTSLTAREKERVELVYRQGMHASELIRQILDFSRNAVMERSAVNLTSVLKEMQKMWQRTLPENIDLRLALDENSEDITISLDLTRFRQALMNLVVNARDAMPGGGELRLALRRAQPAAKALLPEMAPGEWITLAVSDTGEGIAAEDLPHIFEPFFTTKPPSEGTGLGLAQVYGIVKQHGGHIHVDSEVGSGTTVTIYLPVVQQDVGSTAPGAVPVVAPQGENYTLLVCEDDPVTREAVASLALAMGYRVLTAADGETAVEIFRRRQGEIDLVLSDMMMPNMSGSELYRRLRALEPAVKMIVMTGYPLNEDDKETLQKGIVSWLHKPFTAEDLQQVINEIKTKDSTGRE